MCDDVKQIDTPEIRSIARRHGVTLLAVFGSSARATATESSDVDILVDFDSARSLFEIAELRSELSERFGRSVDLMTPGAIDGTLRDRIEREMAVLYDERM